ncbi:MAG: apolipoprotein N-acyltransferase [Bryobacteraceae bacterium]
MRDSGINLLLALLSAGLLVLIFLRFELAILAPVALAPFLVAMAREPLWKRRAGIAWAAGFVYWFGVCYWIQFVLSVHGGLGEAGGWAVFVLFALAKGLHFAAFGLLAGMLMRKAWAVPAVAALWVGIERTHGPLGFAWLTLGDAGVDMTVPMRLVPYIGVYGVSFAFAMMAAAVALAMLRRPRRELLWIAVLPLLYLLPALPEPRPGDRIAAVVQPNIGEDFQWTLDSVENIVRRLSMLSFQAALLPNEPPAELIVWPEAPAPFYYDSNERFRTQVNNLARATGAHVLLGTVAHTGEGAPLNSATMVTPQGERLGRYDKIFLVPFGEFVPPLFGFINKISSEAGNFHPGEQIVVFPMGERRLGSFICYESAFPHLVRRFAAEGAEVFVNLSNDGYFGQSAARKQHLRLVRMRAAENARWIIRSTNDGVTAAIDPAGRVLQRLPENVQGADRLRFGYNPDTTFYSRNGDWFAWLCLLAALAAVASTPIPSYRPEKRP